MVTIVRSVDASAQHDLATAPVQAKRFGAARRRRAASMLEDYTELIADLIACDGEARTTDIAERLGVAHPTAIKAIARLKREGLAVARPYRGVFLTDAGKAMAERLRQRHRLVVDFLSRSACRWRRRKPTPKASSTTSRRRRCGFRRLREIARLNAPLAQALPMAMPAASTSPPPSMTLAAAESGGVSM